MQTTKSSTQKRKAFYESLVGTAHSSQPMQLQSLQGSNRDFELYSPLDYSIQTTVATDTRAIARTA
ncbi:hypothetical protein PS710_04462 [Pseudomonas fluorescens]|uniref:Uncharacterized protein n=1 Tax=Pseudomonas fluorescens TaxID=294 RepID=A0A5E7EBA5_PSEFL|nr:hypothetical protein PS710_04462 [Pseudomonas fluorescens]